MDLLEKDGLFIRYIGKMDRYIEKIVDSQKYNLD